MDVPILFNFPIPETQLKSPNYPRTTHPLLGTITFTSGFMERLGHGYKSSRRTAIFTDGLKIIVPGNYNIGIDFTQGYGMPVKSWYSGKVIKAGKEGWYGNRIHIECDFKFEWMGSKYTIYMAYAHCSKLLKTVGERVSQGEIIGIEAGQGASSSRDYPSHVDLDFYIKDEEIISVNPDVVARQLPRHRGIEKLSILKLGSQGESVKWLQNILKIKMDGLFGVQTESAVKEFQVENNLYPDGIVGEITGKALGMVDFLAIALCPTVLKPKPLQSSELSGDDIRWIEGGYFLLINQVEEAENNHWKIKLSTHLYSGLDWYVFKDHVAIIKGFDIPLVNDLFPTANSVWLKPLINCPTNGCSQQTANAEGLITGGVESSQAIALKDWKVFDSIHLETFKSVSFKYDVPLALMLGLASRESHLGQILGMWGSSSGWGDNNNAFGVFQVDKRYHSVVGKNDPFSFEHISQAMEIFSRFRSQVQQKHPKWSKENILKGACIAYNSGVGNVQTIEGMNRGTTGGDYGDDVIARSQLFYQKLS